MKNSKPCPKCNSIDILRIPGQAGPYGSGNNIQLGWSNLSSIKITRYLCCTCGFSEEWIDNYDDIPKIKKRYK